MVMGTVRTALVFVLGAMALPAGPALAAGLPQLDPGTYGPQVIWLAITFAVLYVLMAKVHCCAWRRSWKRRNRGLTAYRISRADELSCCVLSAQPPLPATFFPKHFPRPPGGGWRWRAR